MGAWAFAAIAVGAVLGAWLRWGLSTWLNPLGAGLPLGTLAANLVGAYLAGLAVAYFDTASLPPELRLAVITGFLGALTTFSTFSLEAVTLIGRGAYGWAMLHMSIHLVGSLAMTALGFASFRRWG